MDKERWQKLQQVFAAAVAVDGEQRERLLQEHARVDAELVAHARALLSADAQPGVMDAIAPPFASVTRMLTDSTPDRIGAYRVAGELGRGGMGVVYLAERADGEFQHQVAIKLIDTSDAGDPRHQRFRTERQILAGLIHPNIARLLDGGLTEDGRPYLVMEYVPLRSTATTTGWTCAPGCACLPTCAPRCSTRPVPAGEQPDSSVMGAPHTQRLPAGAKTGG